jgi:hypothetical protein
MSGRGIKSDEVMPASRPYGLHTRLHSHFSGRRSGDQFCVYVADLLVLPGLTPADIEDVSAGRHRLDAHVRKYIHANLGYRFGSFQTERLLAKLRRRSKTARGLAPRVLTIIRGPTDFERPTNDSNRNLPISRIRNCSDVAVVALVCWRFMRLVRICPS